jgi:ankyrin repeat protein
MKYLITKNPQDVNADGGYYMKLILVTLAAGYFQLADLLRRSCANPHAGGHTGKTPSLAVAFSGNSEVVRISIKYDDADINARDSGGSTPLLWASGGQYL